MKKIPVKLIVGKKEVQCQAFAIEPYGDVANVRLAVTSWLIEPIPNSAGKSYRPITEDFSVGMNIEDVEEYLAL